MDENASSGCVADPIARYGPSNQDSIIKAQVSVDIESA